jgi:hypothetical protein
MQNPVRFEYHFAIAIVVAGYFFHSNADNHDEPSHHDALTILTLYW